MIICDKIISAREYLELMTGHYYILNAPNQTKEVEGILDREFGKGVYWSHSLYDIKEMAENDKKVVLVEIVNVNDGSEIEKLCRWFEIPNEWSREHFAKRLSEL